MSMPATSTKTTKLATSLIDEYALLGWRAMIKNSACDLAVFNRPRRNHGKGDQWNRMALEPGVLPCLPFIPADEQLGN